MSQVCGVEFDRREIPMNKFVATCLESQFHVWDARTHHPKKGLASLLCRTKAGATVWGARHLPQNREARALTLATPHPDIPFPPCTREPESSRQLPSKRPHALARCGGGSGTRPAAAAAGYGVRQVCMMQGGDGTLSLYRYVYPDSRQAKDAEGVPMGVVGSMELLNSKSISTQPVSCFDWSPDKEGLAVCGAFDQMVRVIIVTKLHKV